jgi:hypothetical protein
VRRGLSAAAAIAAVLTGCGGGDDNAAPSHDSAEGAMAGLLAATRSGDNLRVQEWLAPPPNPDRQSVTATLKMQRSLGLSRKLFWRTRGLKIASSKDQSDSSTTVRLSGPIVWCLGKGATDPKLSCAQPDGSQGQAPVYLVVRVGGQWYVDLDINNGRNERGRFTPSPTKRQLAAIYAKLSAAGRRFARQVNTDAREKNLAAILADASELRDAIFEFDDQFRKIDFPAGHDTEVNAVLNASGTAISQLDAIAEADDVAEVGRLFKRLKRERAKLVVATNALAAKL